MLTRLREAGRSLAAELAAGHLIDPIVVAIPRRGAVVGHQIAQRLRVPLDLQIVSKVFVPGERVAVGAIALDGTRVVDHAVLDERGLDEEVVAPWFASVHARLHRRIGALHQGWPLLDLEGRHVVLVDDAVVSGLTMAAAIESIANRGPADVVVATALAAIESEQRLAPRVRAWLALDRRPRERVAVAHVSASNAICPPINDVEVHDLLAEVRRRGGGGDAALVTDGPG